MGLKLPSGLHVLHFGFMWTWPKWNIPCHTGEVVLWSPGYFYRGILLLAAVTSSVGTSTVLVVLNSFCVFLAFFAIKRGKKFDSAELFLEKDELLT